MKKLITYSIWVLMAATLLVACHKDLDRFPPNDVTSAQVYGTEGGYLQVLSKVYGSMALTGNAGPAGAGDVAGIDEGTSDFLRLMWMAQELTTDEAVVAWNDAGIRDFHNLNWSANNGMLNGLYNRCFYIITLSNEFIRESSPERISQRGLTASADNIRKMRAEARFVRAHVYSVLLDLFGNPGFTNEETPIGAGNLPQQITRQNLFNFIEAELKAIEPEMDAPRAAPYGRADRAAAWAQLARLYLNAEVYTGTARWNDAITYSKKVIDGGYTLMPNYSHLFMADNHVNNTEFIWTLNYDGVRTRNFGGTTFLINGSTGGGSTPHKDLTGLSGWSGLRTTRNLPEKFPGFPNFSSSNITDRRALFFTDGHNVEISDISVFEQGLGVAKFRNRTRTGGYGNDPERTYSDVDFPVFRLAEMYLIYAEAVLRGGTGGNQNEALTYFNTLRQRAYGNASGNVSALSLDLLLDERSREMYWEAVRRSDLIRYNRFTTAAYLWPWKGGVQGGTAVSSNYRLFPLPSTEVSANPNIRQNPGY
ncbi:RagB/SusD family nutrient uptake outer membrane protein [Aridibaculum aurantiacum]|uniref:RagB/SusD family nutrient uptake outer membrane protein n=1 Tax=Aridibaculum aurantiacum TaxID=2810307 RepID=UPI001A97BB6F|nr:RagB/SusD family nutrient uptake outer membrane protein [Aridibaculum aurantiacum]